jgi:hypothetical protein
MSLAALMSFNLIIKTWMDCVISTIKIFYYFLILLNTIINA